MQRSKKIEGHGGKPPRSFVLCQIGKGVNGLEVTISVNTIITAAAFLTALGSLGGMVAWWIRFVDRDKKQDAELKVIRKEQTLICYGVMACLRGLKEQGCNGPVTEAMKRMEDHLNQAAHDEET